MGVGLLCAGLLERPIPSMIFNESEKREAPKALNEALVSPLQYLQSLDIRVTVRYIHTSENPADSISRGKEPDWVAALGLHERGGGGGRPGALRVHWARTAAGVLAAQRRVARRR